MGTEEIAEHLAKTFLAIPASNPYPLSDLTDDLRDEFLLIAAKAELEAIEVIKKTREAGEKCLRQEREEVTGMSTNGTNRNFCNTGFGGGSTVRVAPAQTDVQKSKRNTTYVEQNDGSFKAEMTVPSHKPASNIIWVEQDNGDYKPTRWKKLCVTYSVQRGR